MAREKRDALSHPRPTFAERLRRAVMIAAALVGGSLTLGVVGYHHLARLRWVDALLNASMILSGMGPVDPLPSDAAKIFASGYALYSGLVLLVTVSVLISPFFQRALGRLESSLERGRPPDAEPPLGAPP